MTDTDKQQAEEPVLGYYQDKPVVGATVQITNTGAGLDKGLDMAPQELDGGELYDVVLRCRVVEHRHEPLDEGWSELQLVNRLRAEHATIVEPGDIASEALDTAAKRVAERRAAEEKRRREEKGESPLPGMDGDDDWEWGESEPRGGDPEKVGDTLAEVTRIAEEAEEQTGYVPPEDDGADEVPGGDAR